MKIKNGGRPCYIYFFNEIDQKLNCNVIGLIRMDKCCEKVREPSELRFGDWGGTLGVVCVILCVAVSIQYRLVTDRRTDRRTHTHDVS